MAEGTRNLCAQIPVSLHARVMEEKGTLGQALSGYITNILKEHFEDLLIKVKSQIDKNSKQFFAERA